MAFRPSIIKQATLYKFRYAAGYILLFLALMIIVNVDVRILPYGVTLREMDTVVTTMQMSFHGSFDWVINAPFHILQRAAIGMWGLYRLPMALPSIMFGSLTVIFFFLTMRHWFRTSVAIVTTLVAATTGPFITLTRAITPDIMLPFWTIVLLYGAVKVLIKQEKAFWWKLLVVISGIALLYTPFGIYTLLAFVIGGIFHPHVRSRIRRIKLHRKIILIAIGIIGAAPLVLYVVWHPTALLTLTGFETLQASVTNIPATLKVIFMTFVNFTTSSFVGTYIVPAFSIASLCLIALGLFRSVKDHHTTRSYVILSWLTVIVPLVFLAPTMQQIFLIPALLLLAIGCETLIVDWYKLFPRNPYARIAGLIPLTVLFVTIAVTNVGHYFYSNKYTLNPIYRNSLSSIRTVLSDNPNKYIVLITDEPTVAFYSILNREFPKLTVMASKPSLAPDKILVTPEAPYSFGVPTQILTSARSQNGVVLRVYEP